MKNSYRVIAMLTGLALINIETARAEVALESLENEYRAGSTFQIVQQQICTQAETITCPASDAFQNLTTKVIKLGLCKNKSGLPWEVAVTTEPAIAIICDDDFRAIMYTYISDIAEEVAEGKFSYRQRALRSYCNTLSESKRSQIGSLLTAVSGLVKDSSGCEDLRNTLTSIQMLNCSAMPVTPDPSQQVNVENLKEEIASSSVELVLPAE